MLSNREPRSVAAFVVAAPLLTYLFACGKPVCPAAEPEAAKPAASASARAEFPLAEATIAELQSQMEAGKATSRQIVEAYLARIEALDRRGPSLRAVIEIDPEAIATAEALDRERRTRGARGPLHGIPILLKDNIGTAGTTETTAGSLALVGAKPRRDSHVAALLRKAGAVLIGKANLSEWANFRGTHSSSGWSARGGQVRNPYVLDRTACGSSSGSATAVAANLIAVAVGTETDGSIVCPSSTTGLVGIKPTVGLVSRAGIIPIAHSQDTAGPMARTVRDAAVVLGALAGVDSEDPATVASEGHGHTDYTAFLDAGRLKGARIGIDRKHLGADPAVDLLMEHAFEVMRAQGAELVDVTELPADSQLEKPELEVLLFEFKTDINLYLAGLSGDGPRSLAELIAFNEAHASEEMPFFGQELFVMAEEKGDLADPLYTAALRDSRDAARSAIDSVMDQHRLDAIAAPSGSPAWTIDQVNGDHFRISSSTAAAVAGYPNITVPAGQIHGLPVGISFFGRAWSEPTLIGIAYAFEQATHARRAPTFLPTLPFDVPVEAEESVGDGR